MQLSKQFVACCLWVLVLVSALSAQTYNPFNQRDDTYRLLGLKRAKEVYETAQAEYERKKLLYKRELITEVELEQARNQYTNAEVNYQQSLLAVLFEEQYITISQAIKYQASDGSKHVRLTIKNASGGSAEFQKLINIDDALFRSLQPDIVNNVYVSILNDDNAIISQPYEIKIPQLKHGKPVEIDFALLQDLDFVTVFMVYANGAQRVMKVFLQKDASVNRVLVQSEQFSQEVQLGKSSSFDLTLELFSGTSDTYSLEVVNLPDQIGRFFKDPASSVRLSQIKFTESSRTKRAALEVQLPDRSSDAIAMDTSIPFYVLVLPRDQMHKIKDLHSRLWTEAELEALDVGYVRLELVVRGVGELLVRLPQLYHSIDPGRMAEMRLDLLNEGSRRIDNIEFRIDMPLNWTKSIEPTTIIALEAGHEKSVLFTFTPPQDVAPGKYEVRLRTSGMSNGQPISADDKTITIEIHAGTNVFVTILIVVLLVGLVGGIVIYGTRLSKR